MGVAAAQEPGTERPNLLFVMSFRLSLTKWRETGMFDREVSLLNSFIDEGVFGRVLVLSYDPRDARLLKDAQAEGSIRHGIELLIPRRPLRSSVSALLFSVRSILQLERRLGPRFVIRSNQISGAWSAIAARLVSSRPLILRCGYSLSKRFALQGKPVKSRIAWLVEVAGLKTCDVCFVSSVDVKNYYSRWADPKKIVLTPTFVDTTLFEPVRPLPFQAPILYVGRLEPQKNVEALIRACRELGLPLCLVGDGSLRESLETLAQGIGANVTFTGTVANHDLAAIYQQHAIYVLPSHFDPMPKTLIEAMASGLVCVSTPTAGGTELIRDGVSGYLASGFTGPDLALALRRALEERRTELGDVARQHVETHNTRTGFVQREREIVQHLLDSSSVIPALSQPLVDPTRDRVIRSSTSGEE